jgi:quinohemoprotein ethanol dehydrogenase
MGESASRRRCSLWSLAGFAGALTLAVFIVAHAASAREPGATTNWASHGGPDDESGFSPLEQIDKRTVTRLGLAWFLDLDHEQVLEATPLAVNGVLFFTGSHSAIYAVAASSGKLLWKFDPQVWKQNPAKLRFTLPVNRGAAYADGRVFSGTLDGRLVALEAATGKQLWSAQTVSPDSPQTITGAPRVFKGKVIIGHAGADYGSRGYVTAYDQKTGKQVWRFYTAPGSPEENGDDPALQRAAATWSGEYWKTGTGGTVWDGITYDPELNRVYIGTGNSGPYDPAVRSPGGGDNLYLASIVALDADTGKYIWHYQVNPREAWDYKATANMISATLTIEGQPRKVLMQAPTNGFFYVLDRETGKLISAEKIGKVTWAERIDLTSGRPVEAPNIRYETGETVMWPSMLGSHNWQAMSFNPQTGLVYIPYMQLGVRFIKKMAKAKPGAVAIGAFSFRAVKADPEDGKGALLAWDPVTQKARWKVPLEAFWNGGTLTNAGGLVFQGTPDGYLSAFDADTGKRLWKFYAGLGIIAAPISYAVNGKQFVSVLVGYGGGWGELVYAGWKYGAQPRRLLTFALDAKTVLPPSAPRDMELHTVDDPSVRFDEADVQPGKGLYLMNCASCHGADLIGAGAPGPDLRESHMALSLDAIEAVVRDGILLERGMPRFEMLSRKQVQQIHAYLRAGSRESLGLRKPAAAENAGGKM